jgi:hypothetical protein
MCLGLGSLLLSLDGLCFPLASLASGNLRFQLLLGLQHPLLAHGLS